VAVSKDTQTESVNQDVQTDEDLEYGTEGYLDIIKGYQNGIISSKNQTNSRFMRRRRNLNKDSLL